MNTDTLLNWSSIGLYKDSVAKEGKKAVNKNISDI